MRSRAAPMSTFFTIYLFFPSMENRLRNCCPCSTSLSTTDVEPLPNLSQRRAIHSQHNSSQQEPQHSGHRGPVSPDVYVIPRSVSRRTRSSQRNNSSCCEDTELVILGSAGVWSAFTPELLVRFEFPTFSLYFT